MIAVNQNENTLLSVASHRWDSSSLNDQITASENFLRIPGMSCSCRFKTSHKYG